MSRLIENFRPRCPKPLALAVGALASSLSLAQESTSGLEEIIVTSQKRTQILREVPISMVAIDGEKIDKMGVENIEDLTLFAPNIHLTETGIGTQLRIRGIGSDNSQGFEQSVGVYKDGVYHGRAQLFRAPFFDVERIEILRGPQSTLFGKNSIAGAIDVITAKPTDELDASITASYETEYGTRELSGFVSGPLNETLKARVAYRFYDDPGYMENTYKGQDEAQQEEKALRASIAWEPNSNFDLLFTAERDTFDVYGRFSEITLDDPQRDTSGNPVRPTFAEAIVTFENGVAFDPAQNYRRQSDSPEFSNNEINSQTLRMDYDTPAFTITSVTGLLDFNYQENCDCDFTPSNIFDLDMSEDYDQFSQELRLVSADSDTFTWLAGAFYQSYDQTFHDTFHVPNETLLVDIVQIRVPQFPSSFAGTGIDRHFEQESDSYAAFAEATWHATDDLHITLGARYTKEEKQASKILNVVDLNQNNIPLQDPVIAMFYLGLFNTETEQGVTALDPNTGDFIRDGDGNPVVFPIGHNLNGKRTEEVFTPALNIAYDITDNVMTYAKVSKGYQSGGFDPRSNVKTRTSTETPPEGQEPEQVSAFEFEDEQVLALELGSKMRLAGGRVELNAALFKMDYDDLQVSQFDGSVGFNIGNAKETVVQGLELDGRWQITDNLNGSFAYAYLDFEYKDFKNGNCHYPDSNSGFCDYTGKRGVYTPENTLNLSLDYSVDISGDLEFFGLLDAQWVDKQQVHVNLDPYGEIDAHTMLSLRLALMSNNWEVALLGKNLLDEDVLSYSGNAPMSETFFGSRTFYSFVQRPRTVALEATLRF